MQDNFVDIYKGLQRRGCFINLIAKREFYKMVRKIFLTVALAVVAFFFVGCQTVQGIGGDIKWTGEKCAEILEGGHQN